MTQFRHRWIAGLLLPAALIGAAAPAEAQWRDRWRRDRGDDRAALAIGAGIVGLAAGAALASSRGDRWDRWDRWDRRGRWDRWDRRDRWGWGPGWRGRWDPRFDGPGWGGGSWHGGWRDGGRWGPGVRCWRERVWDDWRGRWRRVRVCG